MYIPTSDQEVPKRLWFRRAVHSRPSQSAFPYHRTTQAEPLWNARRFSSLTRGRIITTSSGSSALLSCRSSQLSHTLTDTSFISCMLLLHRRLPSPHHDIDSFPRKEPQRRRLHTPIPNLHPSTPTPPPLLLKLHIKHLPREQIVSGTNALRLLLLLLLLFVRFGRRSREEGRVGTEGLGGVQSRGGEG